jgi:hypothetical protein
MNNQLADVERLKLFCVMNRELRNPVAGLREARAMVELARHSSKLCTRMLATDRRALPAAVDHDLATAGQAFAEVAWRIDEFAQLVERAEAESGTVWAGDLEGLAQALEPAANALERVVRQAGPYLKPLNEPTAKPESPPKRGTRKLLDKYFKNMTLEKRTELLEKSQKEVLDHLEDNGLKTSDRTLRETEAWKAKQVRDWQTKNENKRELENKRFYG